MACTSCEAQLHVEDGHDLCPKCLGVGHLREALSDPCINCSIMPLAVREERLQQVESLLFGDDLPLSGHTQKSAASRCKRRGKRRGGAQEDGSPVGKKAKGKAPSHQDMEALRAEIEQLRALVQAPPSPSPPPPQLRAWDSDEDNEDAMSTRASNSRFQCGQETMFSPREDLFSDRFQGGEPVSTEARDGSETSQRSSLSAEPGEGACSLRATLRAALAKIGMDDTPAAQSLVSNPFFRRTPTAPPFEVPPSPAFLEELRRCWADPRASAHHGRDSRTLASMRNAGEHGLDHMPPVDQCIASLVLSPDEALKDKARCPRPQCRVTDSLLTKAYEAAARMARMGNSLSVLLLAQSQMLQPQHDGRELGDVNDAALQAFGLMTRELGRLMSTLVVTRRQVWLAQAPMSDDCRQALRKLPVVPGQLFGPEAEKALERRKQSSQASEAWGRQGRGGMGPPTQRPKKRGARDPRRAQSVHPPLQRWQQDSQLTGGSWRQPRGDRLPQRRSQQTQAHNQRPPKPPNNPQGTR